MRFAELHAGRVIEAGPRTLDADELARFATTYDPQWFHVDAAAAERGPYHGLIASGWHTCAIAMRLAVDAVLEGSETFGSPGACLHQVAQPGPGRRQSAPARDDPGVAPLEQPASARHRPLALATRERRRPRGARPRGHQPVRPDPVVSGNYAGARTRRSRVISDGAPNRFGGPQ
jgi:hypothetical protein